MIILRKTSCSKQKQPTQNTGRAHLQRWNVLGTYSGLQVLGQLLQLPRLRAQELQEGVRVMADSRQAHACAHMKVHVLSLPGTSPPDQAPILASPSQHQHTLLLA